MMLSPNELKILKRMLNSNLQWINLLQSSSMLQVLSTCMYVAWCTVLTPYKSITFEKCFIYKEMLNFRQPFWILLVNGAGGISTRQGIVILYIYTIVNNWYKLFFYLVKFKRNRNEKKYMLVNGLGMRQTQNDIDLKRNEFGTKLCMGETLRYRLIHHSHLSVYQYVFRFMMTLSNLVTKSIISIRITSPSSVAR